MKLGLYEPNKIKNIDFVTSADLFIKNKPDPKGLYSELIWRYGNSENYSKVAGIDISKSGKYVQPKVLELIKQAQVKIYKAIMGIPVTITPSGVFNEGGDEYDEKHAIYGPAVLKYIYENIDNLENAINPRLMSFLKLYSLDEIMLSSIFVLPPALRPISYTDGNPSVNSQITLIYQSIIRFSNSLLISPEDIDSRAMDISIFRKWATLQKLIVSAFTEYKASISKKEGYIRSNVLGKRVDFSGRAVAAVNPDLKIDEIIVPYKIIAKVLEPFLAYRIFSNDTILSELRNKYNEILVENTFSRFTTNYKNNKLSPELETIIESVIDKYLVKKYPVIIKRDPSLHRSSLQSFNFTCSKDNVIYTSPLITEGFNLDYDGDKLGIFAPMSIEGQIDVKRKMQNKQTNVGSNSTLNSIKQDVALGIYILTKDSNQPDSNIVFNDTKPELLITKEHLSKIDIYQKIKYSGSKGKITITRGQYILNMILGKYAKLINYQVKGKELNSIINSILLDTNNNTLISNILDNLTKVSAYIVNLYPITISPDELNIPENITIKVKEIFKNNDYKSAEKLIASEIMPKIKKTLKQQNSGFYHMIESNARGSWSDVEQLLVAKGYVADAEGKVVNDPITSSIVEGLTPQEILKLGAPTSKGSADRSLNTAETGYLSRQLAYALNTLKITAKDCKTKHTFKIKILDKTHARSFIDRYVNGSLITKDNYESIVGKSVNVRSPITCETKDGICSKCYGEFWKRINSKNIGINASTSLGERGTQLIMRTFHTGGKAQGSVDDINVLEPDSFLNQVGTKIYTKDTAVVISIPNNSKEFKYSKDKLLITSPEVIVSSASDSSITNKITLMKENNISIEFTINSDVEILHMNDSIQFTFPAKTNIATIVYMSRDMSKMVKYVQHLLSGKDDDVTKLYDNIASIYSALNIQSVHYELLISHMNRVADNVYLLWRLNKKQPNKVISIKQIPFKESVLLGILYEDVGKALEEGLINSKINKDKSNDLSPIEQLALGRIK